MAAFVAQFQFLILCIFSGLLGLTILAAFVLALRQGGTFERTGKMFRALRHSSPLVWLCVVPLVCVLVVRGSTKNGGGTNEPPGRMEQQTPTAAVAPEDIARGYRISLEGEDAILPMPSGAVTNELLRRRGGYDWAFRVAPEGWRFPYRDGCFTGVTVFARGEVRPDVGTLYFPVPVTNGVSLLPEARWNLLTNGGASVFSHAVTEEGSLLLDWHNALVGRDVNCPTNLQMELRVDGGFAWRTDDGAQFYLPVLPFDWDGDGLENSVDPDPFVAHPFDCHGANAEWYSVVCSNVFTAVGESSTRTNSLPTGETTFFKAQVNDRAYYFVEVVAERGPAPIYFVADCENCLGSPVLIARGGETNRVPLLIGVEYSVTSSVPIAVSAPDAEYAEIVTNDVGNYTVKWPLEFMVTTSEDGHTVTVTPIPHDPGLVFEWEDFGGASGRAIPFGAGSPNGCSCTVNGGTVQFSCTSNLCDGCSTSGYGRLEGASFPLPTVWCDCSDEEEEDEEPEPPPRPHPDMASRPSVTASFSEPAVLFEDVYTNAPGSAVQKQSTATTLTIEAYGGANGAYLTVDPGDLETKLERTGGHSLPTSRVRIPADSDVTYEITYEGKEASGGENDIVVKATLTAINDMTPAPSTARATSIRLRMEAKSAFPTNRARHVFGPREETRFVFSPSSMRSMIKIKTTEGNEIPGNEIRLREEAANISLRVECGGDDITLPFEVIEPMGLEVMSKRHLSDGDWGRVGASPLVFGQVGVAGMITVRILPSHVSFQHLRVLEGTVPAINVWGCCTNYPSGTFDHDAEAGGWDHAHGEETGSVVSSENLLPEDCVAFGLPVSTPPADPPLEPGGFTLNIPWVWHAKDGNQNHEWMDIPHVMEIHADGTTTITKYGITISRHIYGGASCTTD